MIGYPLFFNRLFDMNAIVVKKQLLNFFGNKRYINAIYLLLAVLVALKQYQHGSYNNYLIFKYTFWHTLHQLPLYALYPAEYFDSNHYGVFFSVCIAPFAALPDGLGMVLWNLANVGLLIYAIDQLPMRDHQKSYISWICAHELLTSLFSFQFNVALTGMLLLSFAWIEKRQEMKSAFVIVAATFIKLYGVVGFAFFFFVKSKLRFILGIILFTVVCLVLPMCFSSPHFVLQTYAEWYQSLVHKNESNVVLGNMQDISLMGMVRRITQDEHLGNLPFLIVGMGIFALPYLRVSQYKHLAFRYGILCSTLIFTVIFSTGSESPTYIIAFLGVAIWYFMLNEPKRNYRLALLIFAVLLTSLSPSDLFPRYVRDQYVIKYALKALPCVLIWIELTVQLLFNDFSKNSNNNIATQ